MKEERLPLSEQERQQLKTTRNGSVLVAVFILVFILGMANFGVNMTSGAFTWVFLCVILFFLLVLGFIIYIRISNAQQREKTVFTGTVTDKKTETSRTRNSSLNEHYSVRLDDEWFLVEQQHFDRVHTGETVSLHCLRGRSVFHAEVLKETETPAAHEHHRQEHIRHQRNRFSYTNSSGLKLTGEETTILRQALFRAVLVRVIGGFLGFYALRYLIVIVALLLLPKENYLLLSNLIYYSYFGCILLFVLLNRKTIRLLRDLSSKTRTVTEEMLIDKIRSNTVKPGPHSVITTANYGTAVPFFYYLQTEKHWLRVSEEEFLRFATGAKVKIRTSERAKVFLGID